MKKFVFILCSLLFLCSCSSAEVKPRLSDITFTAEMSRFNESFTFEGELDGKGNLVAKMTAPEEVKDLVLTLKDGKMTADYKGLVYSPVEGSLPFSSLLKDFHAPLLQIIREGLCANGEGKLSGKVENNEYTLFVAPTGLPQRLEMLGGNFTVRFLNIGVKKVE